MPYNKVSFGRSKNVNLSKYMSPLKLFDYLACERVIIASKLNVYNHILKNNYNSILINKLKISDWKKKIEFVLKNYIKYSNLRNNSLLTSRKFTWKKRVKKSFCSMKNKKNFYNWCSRFYRFSLMLFSFKKKLSCVWY